MGFIILIYYWSQLSFILLLEVDLYNISFYAFFVDAFSFLGVIEPVNLDFVLDIF